MLRFDSRLEQFTNDAKCDVMVIHSHVRSIHADIADLEVRADSVGRYRPILSEVRGKGGERKEIRTIDGANQRGREIDTPIH